MSHLFPVNSSVIRYTSEQRVFLYDTYVKHGSAGKCRRKFRDETVPSRQTIHNLVNKLRTMGFLIDKETKYKHRVLTEKKLDDTGARLEHTPGKSLKRLAQGIGVSKSSARTATKLLKFRPHKTTVIHALQPCDSASKVRFCSWFLQFVVEGEIDSQLTFFSDEAWFQLQGYINMQNNRYWTLQNPHLSHEAPLHPVRAGV
jgi:transposase